LKPTPFLRTLKQINKDTKYEVSIKTYKETISGVFEKFELRYLIQEIDNAIV